MTGPRSKSTKGSKPPATTTKTTAARRAQTPAAPGKTARPAAVDPAPPVAADPPEKFRRPDLIDAVAARTELKRSDAKAVLELVLDELGQALDARDDLALQPLGSLSVKRRKPVGNGDMLTVKIKRRKGP